MPSFKRKRSTSDQAMALLHATATALLPLSPFSTAADWCALRICATQFHIGNHHFDCYSYYQLITSLHRVYTYIPVNDGHQDITSLGIPQATLER